MIWLSEWLKDIIFVVLIATFIDLLLPNRSMERYVKLVCSLLVLLTLLTPILKLFAPDSQAKLEMVFVRSLDDTGSYTAAGETQQILRQGEELKARREEEAIRLASAEAERQMKQQLEREIGTDIERVSIILEDQAFTRGANGNVQQQALPGISQVVVYLQANGEEMEGEDLMISNSLPLRTEEVRTSGTERGQIIPSIEPIEINIMLNQEQDGAQQPRHSNQEDDAVAGQRPSDEQALLDGITAEISRILNRDWGISQEMITVKMQEKS